MLAAGLATAWAVWAWSHSSATPRPESTGFVSPYFNTRPGVEYVGDRVCGRCHARQAEAYHRHPMGRSLEPVTTALALEGLERRSVQAFEALGSRFEVERRGQRIYHREAFRAGGTEAGRLEAEVAYVMGSGSQGRSYLVERDGFLFQSPISWYAPAGERAAVAEWFFPRPAWDLSPGYRNHLQHFNRPITAACLFCHGNQPRPVEHTVNRYHTPAFAEQSSIGCERCHGPGQLHVQSRQRGETPELDLTIVNPARLEPALREAVCQQCHLQGEFRVERRGRKLEDYRPGLPLSEFLTVFVQPHGGKQNHKSVSHVQQIEMSDCFQKSAGANQLGCISCHDAHAPVEPAGRAGHYRSRCLECHQEGAKGQVTTSGRSPACSLPLAERRARQDHCTACHMPRSSSANIVHAAVTDHRILKTPVRASVTEEYAPTGPSLEAFHPASRGKDDPEVDRDLGVALASSARGADDDTARQLALAALLLLDRAVNAHAEDLEARAARGFCLKLQDRLPEALAMVDAVLARQPDRELALVDAVEITMGMGRFEDALRYGGRLLKVNPYSAHYHVLMAKLLAQRGHWQEGMAACRKALGLDPAFIPARAIYIQCCARAGDKDLARVEMRVLLALKPPQPEALQVWFDRLMQE
jgi:hypothetical protein